MLLHHIIAATTAHGRATPATCARSVAFSINSSCNYFPSSKMYMGFTIAHAFLHLEYQPMDHAHKMSVNVDSRTVSFPIPLSIDVCPFPSAWGLHYSYAVFVNYDLVERWVHHCPYSTDSRALRCETYVSVLCQQHGIPEPISNTFSIDNCPTCRGIYNESAYCLPLPVDSKKINYLVILLKNIIYYFK